MANPEKEIREVLGSFPDGRLHTFVSLGAEEMLQRDLPLPVTLSPLSPSASIHGGVLINPLVKPEDVPDSVLGDGRVVVNHIKRTVEVDGTLNSNFQGSKRFNTLAVLAANAGTIVPQRFLLNLVWHQSPNEVLPFFPNDPTKKTENTVSQIRAVLGKDDLGHASKGIILTIHKTGWVAMSNLLRDISA